MDDPIIFFVFLFGLIIGSFLNVVIARRNTGVSLGGRSFCFSCGATLAARDLVPLVSFLASRGRCRYCGSVVSFMYPAVELLTGAIFVLVYMRVAPSTPAELPALLFWFFVFALLVGIVAYDIRHKIIPDGMVWSFVALALISFVLAALRTGFHMWDFLAGPLLAFPFALLWLLSRGAWMGLGDAKIALGIGWLLGLSSGAGAVTIAVWTGACFGVLALLLSKLSSAWKQFTMKSEIPFAPFLALGTLLSFAYRIDFYGIQQIFSFLYPQ